MLIPTRLGGWLQPLRFVSSLEVHLGKALQTVGALFLKKSSWPAQALDRWPL